MRREAIDPKWHPDAQHLIVAERDRSIMGTPVLLVDLHGETIRQLNGIDFCNDFSFAPDGEHYVYTTWNGDMFLAALPKKLLPPGKEARR